MYCQIVLSNWGPDIMEWLTWKYGGANSNNKPGKPPHITKSGGGGLKPVFSGEAGSFASLPRKISRGDKPPQAPPPMIFTHDCRQSEAMDDIDHSAAFLFVKYSLKPKSRAMFTLWKVKQ